MKRLISHTALVFLFSFPALSFIPFLYLTPFSFSAVPPSLHPRNADRASVPSRTLTWWCNMTLRTPAQAAAAAVLPSQEFLLSIHLSYSCTSRRSFPVFSLLLVLLASCTLPPFLTKSETDRKKKNHIDRLFISSFVTSPPSPWNKPQTHILPSAQHCPRTWNLLEWPWRWCSAPTQAPWPI